MDHCAIHQWAVQVAARAGVVPESLRYLSAVDDWRQAWRPESVRVLLIAESHVAEQSEDTGVSVRVPDGHWRSIDEAVRPKLPSQFARLVYCLGYGESDVCVPPYSSRRLNWGTAPYWDMFGQIALGFSHSNRQPGKQVSDWQKRLGWNITVLEKLRRIGVWLVDSSVVGIYSRGGQRRYAGQLYRDLVQESLRTFVWPDIINEPVQQAWVIGTSTAKAIQGMCRLPPSSMLSNAGLHLGPGGRLVIDPTHIIPQPRQAGHEDGLQRLIVSIS